MKIPVRPYKLECKEFGDAHVKFQVYDPTGAGCGMLTIATDDVRNFLIYSWRGNILWNGKMPDWFVLGERIP
jgi:hypothetical protein